MKAVSKIMTAGVGLAALVGAAAPAAAQYYPGYGGGGNVIGQILGQVLGGNRGYGNRNNVSQAAVQQCAAAVENRINRSYGGYGNRYGSQYGYGNQYGHGNQYGYGNQYGNAGGAARVVSITHADRHSGGITRIRGYASSGVNAGYGYGSGYGYGNGYAQQPANIKFKCDVDYRGYVRDIDLNRNNRYGYRRY